MSRYMYFSRDMRASDAHHALRKEIIDGATLFYMGHNMP